jgi:thiamine-monophosphate kinase
VNGEFSLIEKYFGGRVTAAGQNTLLGIGDDAAVLTVPAGYQLVVTMDTLIAGRHFPESTAPFDIGWKSLAVNVSDLAAMAATPFYFLLSLSLPQAESAFLQGISDGLFAAADEFGIELVGGDTCKGSLSITIQATGLVEGEQFVTRRGAKIGDKIFVSGELGAAALGLAHVQQQIVLTSDELDGCMKALNRPAPRIDFNEILRLFATAAIDVSDGLLADLGHILTQSQVGALLKQDDIPFYPALKNYHRLDDAMRGGDDYQLVFTVAAHDVEPMLHLAQRQALALFEIGEITAQGYQIETESGLQDCSHTGGFDHFGA